MLRKILALAAAAAVLVPVLIVGLNAQVKDAPPAETPQAAAADPFLDPTLAKRSRKAETPAAADGDPFANPFADPTTNVEQPKGVQPASKAAAPAPVVRATKKRVAAAARDRGPLRSGERAILKALEQTGDGSTFTRRRCVTWWPNFRRSIACPWSSTRRRSTTWHRDRHDVSSHVVRHSAAFGAGSGST